MMDPMDIDAAADRQREIALEGLEPVDWTVIGRYTLGGQVFADRVEATSSSHAFALCKEYRDLDHVSGGDAYALLLAFPGNMPEGTVWVDEEEGT